MSVETLLLLAVFVLLPIVEQLIKRARQRAAAAAAAAAARPRPVRAVPVGPPPATITSSSAVDERPRLPARSPRRSRYAWLASGGGLRSVDALRQAMAMRVILGPCRALESDGDVDRLA